MTYFGGAAEGGETVELPAVIAAGGERAAHPAAASGEVVDGRSLKSEAARSCA